MERYKVSWRGLLMGYSTGDGAGGGGTGPVPAVNPFNVNPTVNRRFYGSSTESVLTFSMAVWFGFLKTPL